MNKYERNIKLSYILSVIGSGYFWWAIWVLYYLLFVDYVNIGILGSVHMFGLVFFEIPTGALADLLGKKKSLFIAFSLMAIGNVVMGFATGMDLFLINVVLVTLGDAFYSGAFEALVYDSLVETKRESEYQKILARIGSYKSVTIAVVSIIGGFIFLVSPRLPFFLAAVACVIAAGTTLLLEEPLVDTVKVNVGLALRQSFRGFKHLLNRKLALLTLGLFLIGSIVVAGFQLFEDVLLVESGFVSNQLGFIYAIFGVVAAIAYLQIPKVVKRMGNLNAFIIAALVLGLAFTLTPLASTFMVVMFIVIRVVSTVFIENITSVIINENTPSKDRATTLSTFNMFIQLPFAFLAAMIGGLIIKWSIFVVVAWAGLLTLVITIVFAFSLKLSKR